MKFDPVELWIKSVAYSHSQSEATEESYRRYIKRFCEFIETTPMEIVDEYETSPDERKVRKKYSRLAKAYAIHLTDLDYAPGTVLCQISGVKSFFKYNDLPLGFIPIQKNRVMFHNRDITKEEIQQILEVSTVRNKAFYCMMAQAGLRPHELAKLRLKHIEPDFSQGAIPCKVEVSQEIAKGKFGSYFTFMGDESMKFLKAYLTTRPGIKSEDLLFISQSSRIFEDVNTKSISRAFKRTLDMLKRKGLITFQQPAKGKPRTLRLYNLRKYFRKQAGQAGIEYVNFWMGHKTNYQASHIPASDVYYFGREDVAFHRQLYADKALPHLRLEAATPSETDRVVTQQAEEISELRHQIRDLTEKYQELHKLFKIVVDKQLKDRTENV